MRKVLQMKLILFLLMLALSIQVNAQSAFDGFYVGISAGYNQTSVSEGDVTAYYPPTNPSVALPGTYSITNGTGSKSGGYIGGVNIGYDHRINDYVIGGEISISFLQGDANGYAGSGGYTVSGGYGAGYQYPNTPVASSTKLQTLYVIKPKAGFVFDLLGKQSMVYAMGGFAMGSIKRTLIDQSLVGGSPNWYTNTPSATKNQFGYTLGAGVEMMISEKFSIKAELNYVDLGNVNLSYGNGDYYGVSAASTQSVKITNMATTLGLSYKF